MPKNVELSEYFDADFEIAGCELELDAIANDERFARWGTLISLGVTWTLKEFEVLEGSASWWLIGCIAVLVAISDIKGEIKRQGIRTRILILQGYNTSEKRQSNRLRRLERTLSEAGLLTPNQWGDTQ